MKTVSFINQKGGVGKSLLADELAFYLEQKNIDFNFYDLDGQGGLIHQEKTLNNAAFSIVDTPGQLTDDIIKVIKESDIIIVPSRASVKEMEPLERTLQLIISCKKKDAAVYIILNGWNRFTVYSQFEEWIRNEYPEFKLYRLNQSEALAQAGAFGKSVVEYQPKSTAAEQLLTLWNSIERG